VKVGSGVTVGVGVSALAADVPGKVAARVAVGGGGVHTGDAVSGELNVVVAAGSVGNSMGGVAVTGGAGLGGATAGWGVSDGRATGSDWVGVAGCPAAPETVVGVQVGNGVVVGVAEASPSPVRLSASAVGSGGADISWRRSAAAVTAAAKRSTIGRV